MKAVFFDTGPLISISTNNLLGLLVRLKQKYRGRFFITPYVKLEAVDHPLKTKKFKFEALQNLKLIEDGVLEVYDIAQLRNKAFQLLNLANNIFKAHDNPIKIVHFAEIEIIAAAIYSETNLINFISCFVNLSKEAISKIPIISLL